MIFAYDEKRTEAETGTRYLADEVGWARYADEEAICFENDGDTTAAFDTYGVEILDFLGETAALYVLKGSEKRATICINYHINDKNEPSFGKFD